MYVSFFRTFSLSTVMPRFLSAHSFGWHGVTVDSALFFRKNATASGNPYRSDAVHKNSPIIKDGHRNKDGTEISR
jgi:hypothetical protein